MDEEALVPPQQRNGFITRIILASCLNSGRCMCLLYAPQGLLSILQPEAGRRVVIVQSEVVRRKVDIGFFRPIKIKNKYYIVYNNSI